MPYQIIRPNAKEPTQGTSKSARYDLYSPIPVTIKPQEMKIIPTGIAVNFSRKIFGMIKDTSSVVVKRQLITQLINISSSCTQNPKILIYISKTESNTTVVSTTRTPSNTCSNSPPTQSPTRRKPTTKTVTYFLGGKNRTATYIITEKVDKTTQPRNNNMTSRIRTPLPIDTDVPVPRPTDDIKGLNHTSNPIPPVVTHKYTPLPPNTLQPTSGSTFKKILTNNTPITQTATTKTKKPYTHNNLTWNQISSFNTSQRTITLEI